MPKGTLIANSHGQPSPASSVPPSVGPTAVLAAISTAFKPRMRPSRRFGKMVRWMAGAMLRQAAPPMPCSTRNAVSSASDGASAQPSEASVNRPSPATNSRRKPTRAASAAKMASVMATASR